MAVKLGRYSAPIYPVPFQGVEIGILGDLALFNMAVLVLMLERRIRETGFGFLPTPKTGASACATTSTSCPPAQYLPTC